MIRPFFFITFQPVNIPRIYGSRILESPGEARNAVIASNRNREQNRTTETIVYPCDVVHVNVVKLLDAIGLKP